MKKIFVGVVTFLILFNLAFIVFADEVSIINPIPEELAEEPIEDPIDLYFSEIAWMGTVASANDEWIEIYNPNDFSVELDGWVVRSSDSSFEILLFGTIAPDSYFLLERTDDTTVSDVQADQIYTGALKNDGVILVLVDSIGTVVDQIDGWYAGDNNSKATMERDDEDNWCTNNQTDINGLDADANPIFGSPGEPANCTIPIEDSTEDEDIIVPLRSFNRGDVIIHSALPNPDGSDGGREKLILKNTTNKDIPLDGWKLIDEKGSSKIFDSIDLFANVTFEMGQDIFKINLNNNEETLYLYDPTGNLIDEMSWQDAPSGLWIFNLSFLYDNIPASVMEIVDGDTIKIYVKDREMKVRLIGVDTPETVHPNKPVEQMGLEASNFLRKLIQGRTILLKFDVDKTDKYGRLLAYVYLDALHVNAEIIKQGYGYAYTKYPFMYEDDFVEYEELAQKNKIGVWENLGDINLTEENTDEIVLNTEEEFQIVEGEDESLGGTEDNTPLPQRDEMECIASNLQIDSFLPNNEKGESTEYIRLINIGNETACLFGWSLDDVMGSGSDSFLIQGGSIAPSAMRTFRKDETNLALNNSDDCTTLIAPDGEIVDQICYGKTHKNEIFTHAGGDWMPEEKVSKPKSSSSKSPVREVIDYQYEFVDEEAVGEIELIYEEGEMMYLSLDDGSLFQVSYAGSPVDLSMAKQLLDITQPVEIQYRKGGEVNQLIAIDQVYQEVTPKKGKSYSMYIIGFFFLTFLYFLRRKTTAQPSFVIRTF